MDKFVKKLDRPAICDAKFKKPDSKTVKQARLTDMSGVVVGVKTSDLVRSRTTGQTYKRQSRLFELKGVVVLEKMKEYREALLNSGTEVEQKLKILDELLDKQPATEIIKSSKIGKVIRKMAENSNEDPSVSAKAQRLYDKWKSLLERRVELSLAKASEDRRAELEVQYDEATTLKREKSIKMMREALTSSSLASCSTPKNVFPAQEKLFKSIERFVFEIVSKKLLNFRYNRTLRKIVFCFRNNEDLTKKVLFEKAISVEHFVKEFAK